MDVVEEIRNVTERGDIAIVPFLLLGYPTISTSEKATSFLSQLGVTIFETAIPVTHGWSQRTSDTIKEAHCRACKNGVTPEMVLDFYSDYRPNSYVVYEPTTHPSLSEAFRQMKNKVDAVIMEKEPFNLSEFHVAVREYGLRAIYSVSPMMDKNMIHSRTLGSDAFVYLTASSRTGGELYDPQTIQRTIAEVKAVKDIPVLIGFGIKNPEDVRNIGSLSGCDGIIIGTSALQALKSSSKYFRDYFRMIAKTTKNLKREQLPFDFHL